MNDTLPVTLTPPPVAAASAHRLRTRWAILALLLLSPLTAEVLTGSTPPLALLSPFPWLLEIPFYGAGALLVREIARRRGLGWASIWTLGLAYGVLEEGLVITSWFNPYWPDVLSMHGYSRFLELNWVWAASLTLYHATVSITIPILLTEILFPRVAAMPWFGKKGLVGIAIVLALTSLFQFWLFGFALFANKGYAHPPASYAVAFVAAVVCIIVGLRLRPKPKDVTPATLPRPLPRLWLLRFLGFLAMFSYFFIPGVLEGVKAPWPLTLGVILALAALAYWRVATWAQRPGWNLRHMLALGAGVLGFFVLVFAPLETVIPVSTGKNETGVIGVAALYLILLIVLARRARSQTQPVMDGEAQT